MGSLNMLRAHNTMRDTHLGDQKNKETSEQELKPLRYNPGLKCDPELHAMSLAPTPYSSYVAPFPCDQLHQIKMRNRRFQQSCALDTSAGHRAQPGQAALAEDMMMMTNMAYSDLQRQVQMFQTLPAAPLPPTRSCMDEEFLSVDMLPTPRKIIPKPP